MKIALALIGFSAALFAVVVLVAADSVVQDLTGLAVAAFVFVTCCMAGLLNGKAEK
jgi:hypothetical protein